MLRHVAFLGVVTKIHVNINSQFKTILPLGHKLIVPLLLPPLHKKKKKKGGGNEENEAEQFKASTHFGLKL